MGWEPSSVDFDFRSHSVFDIEGKAPEGLPDFCHKCGKCCRSATAYQSPEELQRRAVEGDKDAMDFLEVFEAYPSVQDAMAAEPEQVRQVMAEVEGRTDLTPDDMVFYHCRYVTPEGMCGIYERRPRFCQSAPGTGWTLMPPGCGFEGWQFEQREKHKALVRNLKTNLYLMEQLSPDGVVHPLRPGETIDALRKTIGEKIKPWEQFGAAYW
jgi:Fe-S-cluster containining protein